MIIKTIPVSPFMTNCYIFACDKTKEAAIIDAGDESEKILESVDANELRATCLIATHAHIDHISAVYDIKSERNIPFLMHKGESPVLGGFKESQVYFGFGDGEAPDVDEYIDENRPICIGDYALQVIETPGHSPGGICLAVDGKIFVGDTLFSGSVGRTDLPGGSSLVLLDSIHKKLMRLEDSTIVYPGHGPATSIGAERRHNPFLNGQYSSF